MKHVHDVQGKAGDSVRYIYRAGYNDTYTNTAGGGYL